ncbi:hypothetical protein F66182_358 [Fusarium sp. NRRL 66182]|nr:hypothetical protein F66182_358 [Fusarium sp. NRRL 66182]
MAPPNRQRNPASERPGRLKLSVIGDTFKQAPARSRSPLSLSPISKDRTRRRSSSSTNSHAAGFLSRHARGGSAGTTFDTQDQPMQPDASLAFPLLSPQQDSLPFPQLSVDNFDESAVYTDDELPSQGQSPIQPSAPGWQMSAQPLRNVQRFQSAKVKDGQMIRITLKTQTTQVPCIAKCYLTRQSSVVDNDFARNWGVKIHPVPKPRWRDARHFGVLDVVDAEIVGGIQQQLQIRLAKLPDQRVSVELGVEALKSLGLVDEAGKLSRRCRVEEHD